MIKNKNKIKTRNTYPYKPIHIWKRTSRNKQLTCLFNSGFCHFMCMPSLIFNENLDVAASKIEKQLSSQDCLQFSDNWMCL